MTPDLSLCPSRRQVLGGLAAVVLLPGTLAACGGDGAGPSGSVPAADVPVGTARVVDSEGGAFVVAQPEEGRFVALSARCTHQGTTVSVDEGVTLVCPAHGSAFDAGTGNVLRGPAGRPLPTLDVLLDGDTLVVG